MSSTVSTPALEPHSSQTLPPVSPSPHAARPAQGALDGDLPPLSLEILTDRADKAAALKLIADSIAQQRQQASFYLIFHPLPLAGLLAVLAVVYHFARTQNMSNELGTTMMLASGVTMTYLIGIRFLTSGYLQAAERITWDFLTPPGSAPASAGGQEDLVIGTRFGKDIIGALVLRLERPSSSEGGGSGGGRRKAHSRQNSLKGGKGVIRAWTTKLRYRGKGVGGDMLREAVRVTRERCGKDAEVGFAQEHANSVRVLPERFNKPFRRKEMRAARALESVLAEWDGRKR
ncbi:73c62171-fb94-4613-ba34-fcc79f31219e [Thermothielavioides terrestris]|uniref:Uncharacterized protein n=2 Tax=Thermothielavioides terrestris TaxID=2587410 RepID=G2QZU7_THETT|nr:uncharacterized protein THITE_2116078 [Thermothielavioides terrestris NRRL 8126]AEO67221.1 hypothetical protein THITE_2116078 [Thermothielavioides terrestris NRRL 8126]SPQ23926.1 73c62171-fb94-4613-ba34-fcc79f31219e [Thermothielavioides terrestris]